MLKTPEVNGARQELPYLETPGINGARQSVEVVEKYVNGAWQEVWSNVKLLSLKAETVDNCRVTSPTEWGEWTNMWAMDEDGYVIYTVKGNFNNPKIVFNYQGYYYYRESGYDRFDTVGSLSAFLP